MTEFVPPRDETPRSRGARCPATGHLSRYAICTAFWSDLCAPVSWSGWPLEPAARAPPAEAPSAPGPHHVRRSGALRTVDHQLTPQNRRASW